MIMCTYNILAVTSRELCNIDFLAQINKIAQARPAGIILREKDLSEQEYRKLAEEVINICKKYDVLCILHSFFSVAIQLQCRAIHLPMWVLRQQEQGMEFFHTVGVSVHSVEEAIEAEKLGATYIIAGHIFKTDCKKDLAPRGLQFLESVVKSVNIPVYAIGGIMPQNADSVLKQGAEGICVMSGFMRCTQPKRYMLKFASRH